VLLRQLPLWLVKNRFVRGVFNALLAGRARRHVAELDAQSVGSCQNRILTGLVHQAQATRFGLDHDFRRIRTVADFHRLVPLRTPLDLWRDYWRPAFPNLAGVTWPGPFCDYALPATPLVEEIPWLPVSDGLRSAHRRAAFTALSLALSPRSRFRAFDGTMVLLDEPGPALGNGDPPLPHSVEALVAQELSPALHIALSEPGAAPIDLQVSPVRLSAQLRSEPQVTCIAGTAEHLRQLAHSLRSLASAPRLAEAWPSLHALFYLRTGNDPERSGLAHEIGLTTEECARLLRVVCLRPEGPIAAEDPRHEALRLLTAHGVYFEFVPLDQLGSTRPLRLSATQVEAGVPYAVALTSPAGFWACLIGLQVCFEHRDPPLLRILDSRPTQSSLATSALARSRTAHPFPPQPPHVLPKARISLPMTVPHA
jgi:hypothetical protein